MPSEWENNSSSSSVKVSSSSGSSLSASSSTATSPEPNTNGNNNNNDSAKNGHAKDCTLKASTMSHDPTPYVARARVTRPAPPKPSCNPMQFVQIKPCNLYQSAQHQIKKVEEIKKVKEVLKEEPEDWQNNLDNWKSSRRKRVEHIIERVVEVKKLELEEHDRTRRKSKTFSEMMEERGERGRGRPKLQSLVSYNEDEANDLSDLGIGTSSASGKSSISEDCEVHSIVSEPAEVEHLSSFDIENNSCQPCHDNHNLDRISSPGGYETSSTAPVASPDPYEYTYEGAIEDYKSRVSKASSASSYKKPTAFEMKLSNSIDCDDDDDNTESLSVSVATVKKEDLPKIDISKKRELFEKPEVAPSSLQNHDQNEKKRIPSEFANVRSIKDRLCSLEKKPAEPVTEESAEKTTGIISGEIYSIKERLQCLEQHNSVNPKPNISKVVAEVVAVPPLKDRLSSLQNAVTKEDIIKKPVVLVDEYQLEMLKNEDLAARRQLETSKDVECIVVEKAPSDDSGINTTDEKIDHDEPIVTEDEDDDDVVVVTSVPNQQPEGKVPQAPAATSNNEIQGEFDSSVSLLQLKNSNTPTVVSLVDKPVVVVHDDDHVGGGGGGETLFNSSKAVVPKDKNSDGEVNHAQNLLKMFKMAFDSESDVIEESVKSGQVRVGLEQNDKVKSGGILVEDKLAAAAFQVDPNNETKRMNDKEICIRPVTPVILLTETVTKLPSEKVLSAEEILNDKPTVFVGVNGATAVESVKPQELQKEEVEVQNIFKRINQNSRFGAKSPEPGSNLILNIDNNQYMNRVGTPSPVSLKSFSPVFDNSQKSPNSVSSKIQQINSSNAAFPSLQICQKSSKSAASPVSPKTQTHDMSPKSPTIESLVPLTIQVSNPSLSCENSQWKSSSPRTVSSPSDSSQKSPIYENIDYSPQSPCVGLRKVSSQNNGRVEIFNSKSMPAKPKSPEVLPRSTKSHPIVFQSKDFNQQAALSDFIKDLEAYETETSAESKKSVEPSVTKSKPVEEVKKDETGKVVSQIVSKQRVIQPSGEMSVSKAKPVEEVKLGDTVQSVSQNVSETTSNSKETLTQPTSPLPFDSCVDILQSFLAAERSSTVSPNIPSSPVVKSSNDAENSRSFLQQESIVEVPCSKLDVKDLPDPNFIRTPCIDVDSDEKVSRNSIKPPQTLIRDSISSTGDSSPSSDITVIFRSTPESPIPTPNKSALMDIANRASSPMAARRDPLSRQKPVSEKPCLKLDVKDLPDPNFIRTECIEVDKRACGSCSPLTPSTPGDALHKTNADILRQTCEAISTSPPLSPVLGGRNAEKPNFMIARVEVVETKIKVTTTNEKDVPPAMPTTAPPQMPPTSPKSKPKSTQNSKPKNIFEFLKKNFQSKPESIPAADEFKPISVDNSMFYVPSDVIVSGSSSCSGGDSNLSKEKPSTSNNHGVNIEITKTITSDAIVEQTDSELTFTDEINEILDEEISKLVVEDANL